MKNKTLLIKNGSIVSSKGIVKQDIFISDGKIVEIGESLENNSDNTIDASGKLVSGESFKTHEEFQKILLTAKRDDFLKCVSEMMLTYALGRGTEFYDKLALEDIVKSLKSNDMRFSALVLSVVNSVPFQYRRGDGRRIYD